MSQTSFTFYLAALALKHRVKGLNKVKQDLTDMHSTTMALKQANIITSHV